MLPSVNGASLLAWVVYLPRHRRKKKAMQAMSVLASAPGYMDVVAMSMVVRRILRGVGWMQLGAGSGARKQLRQKSMVPSTLSQGCGVPSRANVWPTEWSAFSTVQD